LARLDTALVCYGKCEFIVTMLCGQVHVYQSGVAMRNLCSRGYSLDNLYIGETAEF